MPRGLVRAIGEVFQGGGLAAMRDCMREAGSWQLRRRVGQHLLFGLPRQVRRHRRGHVPRGGTVKILSQIDLAVSGPVLF